MTITWRCLRSPNKIASTQCQTGRVVSFEETSEISAEIAAEFGFFPVNTEMKAQWACANIFRWLKSYIVSFLYLYLAIFCCWAKTRAKSGIGENICGATIQMDLKRFHGDFTALSVSIDNYLSRIESKINNLTFKEGDTSYYGRRKCSSWAYFQQK